MKCVAFYDGLLPEMTKVIWSISGKRFEVHLPCTVMGNRSHGQLTYGSDGGGLVEFGSSLIYDVK